MAFLLRQLQQYTQLGAPSHVWVLHGGYACYWDGQTADVRMLFEKMCIDLKLLFCYLVEEVFINYQLKSPL